MPLLKDLFPTARKTDQPPSPSLQPRRKRSAVDLRRLVTSSFTKSKSPSPSPSTMSKSSPFSLPPLPLPLSSTDIDSSSLAVFVLLPPSASAQQLPTPTVHPITARPSPLVSRKSTSAAIVPIRKDKDAAVPPPPSSSTSSSAAPVQGVDQVIVASRRLSLAPGLGSGTSSTATATAPSASTSLEAISASPRTSLDNVSSFTNNPAPPASDSGTGSTPAAPAAAAAAAPPAFGSSGGGGPPAFGAKRSSTSLAPRSSSSRRRPQTATNSGGPSHNIAAGLVGMTSSRASLAAPGGHFNRNNRPGWEADEIIGTLRNNGLEVTVVRQASQLPSLLDPSSDSTLASTHLVRSNDSTEPPIHVVLVPLADSTSLPSLSLLFNQGTTPTAVCFQQDLLERAKKLEEEWLHRAVEQIKQVAEMRDQLKSPLPPTSIKTDVPVIIAYSANPSLSPSAIAACMAAGAAGILKPPYCLDTADAIRRVVQAYRNGTDLPSAMLSPKSRVHSPSLGGTSEMSIAEEPTVVLPPTALSMGGEHEGEKVLSAVVAQNNRRRSSTEVWNDENGSQPNRPSLSGPSGVSRGSPSSPHELYGHSAAFPFDYQAITVVDDRRRSVDVGGLSLALKRAQKAFELATPGSIKPVSNEDLAGYSKRNANSIDLQSPTKARSTAVNTKNDFGKDMEVAELLSAMYSQTMLTIQVQMSDYDELSAPLSSEHRERLVDQLSGWNFKPHTLAEGDLYRVACLIFEAILSSEGLAELKLERDKVNRLLFAIRAIYHAPNPYHNYVHAIDVLQATYTFLVNIGLAPPYSYMRDWTPDKPVWKRSDTLAAAGPGTRRAREVISPQDVLAIIVAAMGHDVGHPGLSNAFMKNAKVPLSQVYEDKSVLENMHCMLIVQLLRKHGFQYLVEGPPSPLATVSFNQKGFRKVLYSSVLATDMSLHFAWIARLKEFDERLKMGVKGTDEDDRIMICQALIKCADISNPTRPIDVSQHWSSVLLEEWAKQASLEQDLDLPVSVVASADAKLQANGQIGFIDLFTQPLFEAVSEALPEIQLYADCCSANRALWKGRLDQLAKEAEEEGGNDIEPMLIQPPIEGESKDERFKSLFPLLLPESLIMTMVTSNSHSNSAEDGEEEGEGETSDSSPSTPEGFESESGSSKFPGTSNTLGTTTTTNNHSHIRMRTPEPPHSRSQSQSQQQQHQQQDERRSSPANKAMRAVYHSNLKHSPSSLSSSTASSSTNVNSQTPFSFGKANMKSFAYPPRAIWNNNNNSNSNARSTNTNTNGGGGGAFDGIRRMSTPEVSLTR